MAFQKTNWEDTIKDAAGNIVRKGTPLSAKNLNNIEAGIVEVAEKLADTAKSNALNAKVPFGTNLVAAKGDGVTDDTVAIQNMINYCIENKVPFFVPNPDVSYLVKELYVDGNINFFGSDSKRTIFQYTGTETCFNIGTLVPAQSPLNDWVTSSWFKDFCVEGDRSTGIRTSKSAIHITKTVGSVFQRIKINHFSEGGFKVWGKADDPNELGNSVFNNIYHDVDINHAKHGFDIKGKVSDSYFSEGQMNNLDDYGFYFHTYNAGYDVNIHKYTFVDVKKGIFVDNLIMRNLSISGCNFELFKENGILINGATPDGCSVGTISNNMFYSSNLGTEECIKGHNVNYYFIHSNGFARNGLKDIVLTGVSGNNVLLTNKAMNRNLIVDIPKTNIFMRYGYTSSQDVVTFNTGISARAGDLITEELGKGFISKSLDGTKEKRISVSNQGGVSVQNIDGSGSAIVLGMKGTSLERNALEGFTSGTFFFDTTLNKPLWSKSNYPMVWVDAMGTVVT